MNRRKSGKMLPLNDLFWFSLSRLFKKQTLNASDCFVGINTFKWFHLGCFHLLCMPYAVDAMLS